MCKKMIIYLFSTCYSFVCIFKAIKKVNIMYQGQGHPSRLRSNQSQHQIEVIFKGDTLTQVVCIWIKCILVFSFFPCTRLSYKRTGSIPCCNTIQYLNLFLNIKIKVRKAYESISSRPCGKNHYWLFSLCEELRSVINLTLHVQTLLPPANVGR